MSEPSARYTTLIEEAAQKPDNLSGQLRELEAENARLRQRIAELEADSSKLGGQTSEQLTARVAELAALQKVNSAANSSLRLDQMLSLVIDAVADVMHADICSIFLLEGPDRLVLRATRGLNTDAVGRVTIYVGEGITGAAAREGRPIAVSDAWSDPRFHYVAGLGEENSRSLLSVPIILFTIERLIGVLNIQAIETREFSQEEISFLQTVAGQIAIAIENAKFYERTDQRLREKVEQLTTLQRVSSLIAGSLDLGEVMNLVVSEAVAISRQDMAAILQLDEATRELSILASTGLSEHFTNAIRLRFGEGAVGKAVEAGEPVVISDISTHFVPLPSSQVLTEEGIRALVCLPLISRRKTLGALVVYSKQAHEFTEEEVQLIASFADRAAVSLDNALLYDEAQRSLAIKSALLSEMHHRVKNNLQTVASLLSLQARRAKPPAAVEPLWDSVARVQSISAVHDLLSRKQFGSASIEEIAKQIVEVATVNPIRPEVRVQFEIDGNGLRLGSKEATVFALILNEIVGNAIQHGFAGRDQGTVRITAQSCDRVITIDIADDGRGIPSDFDVNRDGGLGLQIVQTLVQTDLQGTFALYATDPGAQARITFDLPAFTPSQG